MEKRENFGSRLGFILVSAGCAVGLGNVWKFPYVCGKNGGALFILIYLFFLLAVGLPILVCEYAVGRGSRKSCGASFKVLSKEGTNWHHFGKLAMAGNYLLMMFYTNVAGWMLSYFYRCVTGQFSGGDMSVEAVADVFIGMTDDPVSMIFWMAVAVVLSFSICGLGVQNGVEKVTKVMMACLLALIVVLAVNSIMLPGAGAGVDFYLKPNLNPIRENGFGRMVFEAMSQAFFTLSLGIGSMAICGSYKDKENSLTNDSICVMVLDTFVAIMAGLIIIPACFSFGVEVGSGPSLIFISLPNIFNRMSNGRLWGSLFFLFLSFAAISTVVAVFENIISCTLDIFSVERKKAVVINMVLVILLSLPAILGLNVLSFIQPIGEESTIMDLEDFIVSSNLLPLGALVYVSFCVKKWGWGFDNFLKEANTGKGAAFPKWIKPYMEYVIPALVVVTYLMGYYDIFSPQGPVMLGIWMAVAILILALVGWIIFGGRTSKDGR